MAADPALRIVDEQGRRQPLKRKLTAAYCRDVQPPGKGRLTIYDTEQPRLALVVTDKGAKAFYLVAKIHNRARRIRLADATMPVADARKLAGATHADMLSGVDPVEERRQRRAEVVTLGEMFTFYGRERERTAKTVEAEQYLWNATLQRWADRRLDSITVEQVAALHGRLGRDNGRTSANRAVQMIRRLYRYAKRRRLYAGDNPAEGIELFREKSRERFVQPKELPVLLKAIDAEADPWPDYFRLLLLTGARRSALASMKWDDVDLDAATWTIPAADSKNKDPLTVALVDEAVERLKRRQQDAGGSPFVFPGRKPGTPMLNPAKAWQRVRDRAGLPDLRLHDLRRTCGSYLAAAGVSLPMIGRVLGHRSQNSTQIYSRLNVDAVRGELAKVGELVAAASGTEADNGKDE